MSMQIKKITDNVLGEIIFPKYDTLISGMIQHFGTWEPNEQLWINNNVYPGSVVYNIGANVGYHAFVSSNAQSKIGRVIAVEASKNLCEIIKMNCEKKDFSNIEIYNFAITDHNGNETIYYSENNCGDNRISNPNAGSKTQQVVSITINELIEIVGDEPDVIIMDIQGWETHVLASMTTRKSVKCLFEFTPSFIEQMGFNVKEQIDSVLSAGWSIKNLNNDLVDLNEIYSQYLVDSQPQNFFMNLVAEK